MQLPEKARLFLLGAAGMRAAKPWEYQIELTNRCNLKCSMCLREPLQAPQEDMTTETMAVLLRNLDGVRDFAIRGWGEPLLHDGFPEFVRRIRQTAPKIYLRVTTNGLLLTGERLKTVLSGDINALHISMESLAEHGNGHPAGRQVADNLRRLVDDRGAGGKPALVMQSTMHPGGEERIVEIVRLANELKAEMVNLIRLDVRLLDGVKRPDCAEEARIIAAARKAARAGMPIVNINHPPFPVRLASHFDRRCLRTMYQAYIDVRGNVLPCCKLQRSAMGNILNESVQSIWSSDRFRQFFADPVACAGCDSFYTDQIE